MEEQIFCDGIGRIAVIGGVVRLDLFTYSPTETDANGNPRPVLSHRIVMGMEGFLRSSEKVVEAVRAISSNRPQSSQQPHSRNSRNNPALRPRNRRPSLRRPSLRRSSLRPRLRTRRNRRQPKTLSRRP